MPPSWTTLVTILRYCGLLLVQFVALSAAAAEMSHGRLSAPYKTPPPLLARVDVSICPPFPDPVASLSVSTPYQKGDPTFSHIDPQAEQALNVLMKPVREFDVAVDVQANHYTLSNGTNVAAGACALAMMDSWAKASAVLKLSGHDAYLFRAPMITALAFDFMQVRDLDTGDQQQRIRIAAWLDQLGADTIDHWNALPSNAMVNLNNHRAWAGLAAAAAGTASNDRRMLAWGLQSAQVVACEATDRGALPREVGRAGRARLYSLFTAEPLVMAAELGQANGTNLYDQCNGAIHKIVAYALRSVDDPSEIERDAQARQESFYKPDGSFNKPQIAWVEAYEHRFPGRAPLPARFVSGRPYFAPDLGGGLTALYDR